MSLQVDEFKKVFLAQFNSKIISMIEMNLPFI